MGAFGYTSGVAVTWRSLRPWKETEARLCGSIQFKTLGDIRWTPELFDLVFTGNAGHLGRWDVLDGSRFRAGTWIQAAIGLEGANRNRIELGLVYRLRSTDARIRNGHLYVSEGLDYLTGYVRGHMGWAEGGSWGLATNAEWHFCGKKRRLPSTCAYKTWGSPLRPNGPNCRSTPWWKRPD